jgi:hypothetical protein
MCVGLPKSKFAISYQLSLQYTITSTAPK